eukprot:4740571-Lingulodinium_polyedra.AAC.1
MHGRPRDRWHRHETRYTPQRRYAPNSTISHSAAYNPKHGLPSQTSDRDAQTRPGGESWIAVTENWDFHRMRKYTSTGYHRW